MKFDTKHDVDLTLGIFDPQDASTTTGLPNLFDNGGDASWGCFLSQPSSSTCLANNPSRGLGAILNQIRWANCAKLVLPQFFWHTSDQGQHLVR